MQIKDKVVVVTGAASGIGKSLCERFVKEGAKAVVVTDINSEGVDATVRDINEQTKVLGITCDVADENEVCLLYTSPSPRDATLSRMPSSA